MKHIGMEIQCLHNTVSREIANLSTIRLLDEITGNNGYILCYLSKKTGWITQKELELALGITRSTASTVLSLMEKKELIIRMPLESDARVKRVRITAKGEEFSLRINEEIDSFEEKIKKGFSKEELELFFFFMERIKKNIKGGMNDD